MTRLFRDYAESKRLRKAIRFIFQSVTCGMMISISTIAAKPEAFAIPVPYSTESTCMPSVKVVCVFEMAINPEPLIPLCYQFQFWSWQRLVFERIIESNCLQWQYNFISKPYSMFRENQWGRRIPLSDVINLQYM